MANLISLSVKKWRGDDLSTATALGLNTEAIISAVYEQGDTSDSIVTYADAAQGRPVKILVDDTLADIAADSSLLMNVSLTGRNGVTYATASNFIINLERIILAYVESGSGATAVWKVWYDTSNLNQAGFDSPAVDILTIDFDVDMTLDANAKYLVGHIGNIIAGVDTGRIDPVSLNVNGNAVVFPDTTNSVFLRAKSVVRAYEDSDTNTRYEFKTGKHGFAELIADESLALNIARSAATVEATV